MRTCLSTVSCLSSPPPPPRLPLSPWPPGTGRALRAHLLLPLWPPQLQCLPGAGPSRGGAPGLQGLVRLPASGLAGDGDLRAGGLGQARQGCGHRWGARALFAVTRGSSPFCIPYHSTCVNGSLVCPHRECPVLGPWSAWSRCSAPCGWGTTERHRSCDEGPGGTPCQAQDTEQRQECNLQPCPGAYLGRGGLSFPPGLRSSGPRRSWHWPGQVAVQGSPLPGTPPHYLCTVPRVPTWPGVQGLRHLVPAPLLASLAWLPLRA